ncbi:MAG TPA: histidinol-phosphate transaminase [Candidatus Sulfotelmatobacter sp.]|jgi:histidinol-phosphate aminotransferase|nr:histidinol-phosphate transaminase [Candidatus Sulfotelmatobacter sp.]
MRVRLPVRNAILDRRTYEAPAEGRRGKIRLDFNENTTGCSTAALAALRRLNGKELAMYPEYQAPTKILARYFGVKPEELLLTNGGDDALRVFFDTFVEPSSHILICEPTFPMYRYYAEIAGARVETLHYSKEMDFPLADVLKALRKKPRVFFVANPNNPTGTLVDKAAIENILKAATHTAVVLDEAYSDFSGVTGVPWIGRHPNLFIAKTFSKAAGLAGLRLGAVIAQHESLALVRRALPPFPVNAAALAAGVAAVRERRTIERYIRETKRLRKWFGGELKQRNVRVFPSAGNFLLADFGDAGPGLFLLLTRNGILIRERSKDLGPGFARITIGTKKELQALLRILDRTRR